MPEHSANALGLRPDPRAFCRGNKKGPGPPAVCARMVRPHARLRDPQSPGLDPPNRCRLARANYRPAARRHRFSPPIRGITWMTLQAFHQGGYGMANRISDLEIDDLWLQSQNSEPTRSCYLTGMGLSDMQSFAQFPGRRGAGRNRACWCDSFRWAPIGGGERFCATAASRPSEVNRVDLIRGEHRRIHLYGRCRLRTRTMFFSRSGRRRSNHGVADFLAVLLAAWTASTTVHNASYKLLLGRSSGIA